MAEYIVSSGETESGIILENNFMTVLDGGVASTTTVNDWGLLYVSSGGTANSTTVNSIGYLYVSSGGTANSTTVNDGGRLFVYSGGTANNAIINSGGRIEVSSGGTGNSTTVNTSGHLWVYSGGSATNIVWTPCEGHVYVSDGGYATFTSEYSGVYFGSGNKLLSSVAVMDGKKLDAAYEMYVMNGGTANSTTVNSGGLLRVSSGGTANSTMVNDGGLLDVSSGGTANSATVNSGGRLYVSSDGTANNAIINSGGRIEVSSGGTGNETTVNFAGMMLVSSGGTATTITENGGYVNIYAGAQATFVPNSFSGTSLTNASATVHSGTTANQTEVYSNSLFNVFSGGVANGVTIANTGRTYVYADGTANDIVVSSGGSLTVSSGGVALNIMEDGGYVNVGKDATVTFVPNTLSGVALLNSATVHSGTTMSDTIVGNGGEITVFSGGIANGTTVNWGTLGVSCGGIANSTTVNTNGHLDVSSGGTANITTVNTNGHFYVSNGGTANYTTVNAGGQFYVSSGGSANSTTLLDSTIMKISSGGTANDIVVSSGGSLTVSSGGVALNIMEDGGYVNVGKNANVTFVPNTFSGLFYSGGISPTIHSGTTAVDIALIGGKLSLYSGGKLTGRVILPTGGPSAESGSIVDFDLTRIMPGAAVRISNLSKLKGTPTYTITVNTDQAEGIYALADNVNSFDQTITVLNPVGKELGTISVGETITIEDVACTLTLSDSILSLKIGEENTPSPYTSDGLYIGEPTNSVSVQFGEVFYDTLVGRGKLHISSGGHAINTMLWGSLAHLHVSSGGMATHTTIVTNTSMSVSSGGTANDTIVNGGVFFINSNGLAENTVVNSGTLHISSGGTALEVLENGGNVEVEDGAMVTFVPNVFSGSFLRKIATIHSGTTANSIFVVDGDGLHVSSGGVANDTTVAINRGLYVSVGGVANYTTVGGMASHDASAVFDGTANNTTINYLGVVGVYGDGIVNSTTINSRGGLILLGGTANITTVNSGGRTEVYSGCTANSTTVNSGGSMIVSSGGKLTGQMSFANGAVISAEDGAILDFDISELTPEVGARVKNLSLIQGASTYTLTVSDTQAGGIYTLAEGAADFNGTITVQNALGESFCTVTVGETIKVGYNSYTLNLTDSTLSVTADVPDMTPSDPIGTAEKVSWKTTGAEQYIVEYSTDNFEHVIQMVTTASAIDMPDLPAGNYQWRVKADANSEWAVGEAIVSEADSSTPKVVQAVEDGNDDLFFATTCGTWENIYYAQHVGSINDWTGTNEIISASGKGRIQNLFFGSSDPNVLCLTDGENGDAIFVDDVYTELPESVAEHTARLYKIQEVRAGAGDDIVDMTSQRFEYIGDGLTIRGGDGNDTIWATKGDNWLFGDTGNDRIVGASGNDVIAGGIGNDRMHGGGGSDIFTFCDNWGVDNVEQLADGKVTLWFASGSMENWNAGTLTYTEDSNSVTVKGVSVDKITLKFGGVGEDAAMFATLSEAGAFKEFTSQKIFEENKGLLA